jgi:hypothetical protein
MPGQHRRRLGNAPPSAEIPAIAARGQRGISFTERSMPGIQLSMKTMPLALSASESSLKAASG